MKKITLLFITILLFVFAANAKTVKLSNFAIPDDGLDDSVGFQAAVNDLKANKGGTLEIDAGVWNLSRGLNFTTFGNYVSYRLVGDAGSVIRLSLSKNDIAFYVGNANSFVLENLIITGDGSVANYDCAFLLYSAYTEKTIVRNTQFFGIRAKQSLVYIGNTDGIFENCQFDGISADVATIYGAYDLLGLSVQNTNFRDYGNFLGDYYSKTPSGIRSWILVDRSSEGDANFRGARVRLTDVRMDEGATTSVLIKNVPNVEISGMQVNVGNVSNSSGITLDKVKYATITNSSFGYATNSRPAIILQNNSTASISHLRFGSGVYFAYIDGSSTAVMGYCPDCERFSGAAK